MVQIINIKNHISTKKPISYSEIAKNKEDNMCET